MMTINTRADLWPYTMAVLALSESFRAAADALLEHDYSGVFGRAMADATIRWHRESALALLALTANRRLELVCRNTGVDRIDLASALGLSRKDAAPGDHERPALTEQHVAATLSALLRRVAIGPRNRVQMDAAQAHALLIAEFPQHAQSVDALDVHTRREYALCLTEA